MIGIFADLLLNHLISGRTNNIWKIKLDQNNSLFDLIQQHIAGEKVSIEYWRAAEKKQLEVTLGELK